MILVTLALAALIITLVAWRLEVSNERKLSEPYTPQTFRDPYHVWAGIAFGVLVWVLLIWRYA